MMMRVMEADCSPLQVVSKFVGCPQNSWRGMRAPQGPCTLRPLNIRRYLIPSSSAALCVLHFRTREASTSMLRCENTRVLVLVQHFADASKLKDCPLASVFLSWLLVPLLMGYSFPVFAVAEVDYGNNSSGKTVSLKQMYDPVSAAEREGSQVLGRRVEEAVSLLDKGKQAQAEGDYNGALLCYNKITEIAGDLALADYARVGHAISLYEVGDRAEAILEMEDMSIILKGYPEVHAALAAALYTDKHAPIPAEHQFTIATLLDPRYSDLSFVKESKHWPPSLVCSLEKFLSLK